MIALRKEYENNKDVGGYSTTMLYSVDGVGAEESKEKAETVFGQSMNCKCGAESTRGCHGVRDGEVYSEYFCDEHFNKREK
jgi:hypothetical protein